MEGPTGTAARWGRARVWRRPGEAAPNLCGSCPPWVLAQDGWDWEAHPDGFIMSGSAPKPGAAGGEDSGPAVEPAAAKAPVRAREDADGVLLISSDDEAEVEVVEEDAGPAEPPRAGKRKAGGEAGGDGAGAKRAKQAVAGNVVELD